MRSPVTKSVLSWMALVLAATPLAGCGGETPPAEAAPELADRLSLVDRAVASGDETAIRRRVDSLVAATEAARDGGRIDEAQAERILAAAETLLVRLATPEQEPAPPPPTSSATPPPPENGEGDEGDEGRGKGEDDEKARKEAEKRREELEKQREHEARERENEAKKEEEQGEGDD